MIAPEGPPPFPFWLLSKAREIVAEDKLMGIESLVQGYPELIESFLDERYTREVVGAVPGYVRRTLQLSRMDAA